MRWTRHMTSISLAVVGALLVLGTGLTVVTATEPCGDFDECIVLIEINSSDGDIGFHFLSDAEGLISAQITDPNGARVFEDSAKGPLKEQKLTETFGESAEPLCWQDPEADPDEEIVTLQEFLARWAAGTYVFSGTGAQGEKLTGTTQLTYHLPAAPQQVAFNVNTRVISWAPGDDLGKCASNAQLDELVPGVLPVHPEDVLVGAYEVVLEPDVAGAIGKLKFTIRVPGNTTAVKVPAEYLAALPDNTPAKVEVGAIGVYPNANATFTEVGDLCLNEVGDGCE